MRGRVDESEGYPARAPAALTTNLIQKFSHGLGLSRLFQIKERTPSPTFGAEVQPVVVVDELLQTAYPPWLNVCGGTTQGPGAPGLQPRYHAVRCRGAPSTDPNPEDRLVIHEFTWNAVFAADLFILIGFDYSLFGVGIQSTNMFIRNVAEYQPGLPQSDFSHFIVGEDPAALPITPPRIAVPANTNLTIRGPWVIGPGQIMGVRTTVPTALGPSTCWFTCTEYPAKG